MLRKAYVTVLVVLWSCCLWAQVSMLASQPDLVQTARTVNYGDSMFLDGLDLTAANQSLQLKRFQVWADDAVITVHGDGGDYKMQRPEHVYFGGSIVGVAGSRVFMSILEDGRIHGLASSAGRWWAIGQVDGSLKVTEVQEDLGKGAMECSADLLEKVPDPQPSDQRHAVTDTVALGGTGTYNVRVAIESDFEFYQIFGNSVDATAYIGDIIAYASTIYADEVDTNLVLGDVSLWSNSGDPWSNIASASCGLYEFGKYWNTNNTGTARTIAHFFSGKVMNQSIAWVGVLCQGTFSTNAGACLSPSIGNYGGDYGFTTTISGNFDINNPQVIWDILSVTHEIGHNFNSPHTHCYAGLEGNAQPVDKCIGNEAGANCYAGATSLPCGTPGAGCGTIMSYCHLVNNNYHDISLTLGLGHPFGVAPERVPNRMNAHVVSRAGSFPACITTSCTNPSISASSGGLTRCVGSSATFTVTASNATSYQWQLNSADIPGETASSITIDPIESGDAGTYRCVVTNACGSVNSTGALLTVNPLTVISAQSSNLDRCVGSSAAFSVTASGAGSLTYQWRKASVNIIGATSSSYTINAVTLGDAGSYDCVVTGSCGSTTSAGIALTVRTPMAISSQPVDSSRCVGQSASFSTTITGGYSTISYQWYHGVIPVGTNSSTLSIGSVSLGDAGSYSCTITDGCGSISTETHTLTVGSNPVLNQGPQAASRCVGDSVSFSVNVTGTGLGYQWQKNMSNIGSATAATYTIASVTLGSEADYRCVITSACGDLTTDSAHLSVTNGSFDVQATANVAVQGLELVTLEALVSCGGDSLTTTWRNINTGTSYGANVNPLTLPAYLDETTLFRVTADNGVTQITDDVIVLAAANLEFLDLNGDGCNDINDLLFIVQEWRDQEPDANGDGILNLLDFITINLDGICEAKE